MGRKGQHSKVTSNMEKNRLVITLVGTIRKSEMERIYTDVRFCVQDLQPGFHVITDMQNCKIGYLSGALVFKKIMEFLISKEVGKVVRITGGSRSLLNQMVRMSQSISGYSPEYVSSPEEAEKVLAEEGYTEISD